MAYKLILYDKDKDTGAAVITLNKPEVLNAWGGRMKDEILDALNDASADPNVWGVIFTGAGRGFSAGGFRAIGGKRDSDYEPALSDAGKTQGRYDWLTGDEERSQLGLSFDTPHLIERLLYFDKPSIAAVNGIVAGGTIALMCASDIRIASDQARFRMAFTRDANVPSVGTSYWLTKLIGTGHTLELAYTNDFIDAKDMERIGMVNRVVAHNELIPYCKEMINRMKQIAPSVLFATKRAIQVCGGITAKDLEEGYMYEGWSRGVFQEEEREEGRKSLLEKRQPAFKGRGVKANIRW